MLLSSASIWAAAPVDHGAGYAERCRATGVVLCVPLDSEAGIAALRSVPRHLDADTRIQYDPAKQAARFTVPSRTSSDSSGFVQVRFPKALLDVYVSFDVFYPADFLAHRFRGGGGWKMFILAQGREGCGPHEVVGQNSYQRGYPQFYYLCGVFAPVQTQNPYGDNSSEFDLQPGGDTQCLMHGRAGSPPCARFVPDQWVTYQVHVNSVAKHLEVWQTVQGKTLKIINYHLDKLPNDSPKYEWIMLTPYHTGKDPTEEHPRFHLWYRRVVVSTRPIQPPAAD